MATKNRISMEANVAAVDQNSSVDFKLDFDRYFPTLMDEMSNFDQRINLPQIMRLKSSKDRSKQFYEIEMSKVLERVDQEVYSVLGEPWCKLKEQNSTFVARHTLLVLAAVIKDPLYTIMSP